MMRNCFEPVESRRCSRYAVMRTDFLRISAMEVVLKSVRAPASDASSIAEVVEIWKPLAPAAGRKTVLISYDLRDPTKKWKTYSSPWPFFQSGRFRTIQTVWV
jgi:hypothetical protein